MKKLDAIHAQRGLLLVALALFTTTGLTQAEKVLPTPEQQAVINVDLAIPADRPAIKMGNYTMLKGQPNPKFGNPQERFLSRHEAFLDRRKQPMDVLFIGDSITEAWQTTGAKVWKAGFADRYNVANFGISGDRTQHVLWRIENGELDGCSPKVVVLLIGTNNSAHNTPEEVAAGVTKIVGQIKTRIPSANVVLLNLLPRAANPSDPRRELVKQTNEIIAKLDNGKDVFFLELWNQFLDDKGMLQIGLMPDGLHPSEAGYEIMAKIIQRKLAEL